jgi:hypothetical protein
VAQFGSDASGINATFTVHWGPRNTTLTNVGEYTSPPTNPVSETGGSGVNAAFSATWKIVAGGVA